MRRNRLPRQRKIQTLRGTSMKRVKKKIPRHKARSKARNKRKKTRADLLVTKLLRLHPPYLLLDQVRLW